LHEQRPQVNVVCATHPAVVPPSPMGGPPLLHMGRFVMPAAGAQPPPTQPIPLPHTCPHVPQLALSFCVSTPAPVPPRSPGQAAPPPRPPRAPLPRGALHAAAPAVVRVLADRDALASTHGLVGRAAASIHPAGRTRQSPGRHRGRAGRVGSAVR